MPKKKPNFISFGNKKSGKKKGPLEQLFTPAKKQTKKTHHDSLKRGQGNGGGRRRG
ncbi:hypothetical protein JNJ66_07445 [Candidatus Saccharibacteria bacterium]|nr:hypothetical protein [Candidatus Saccharibacteria bacterium]